MLRKLIFLGAFAVCGMIAGDRLSSSRAEDKKPANAKVPPYVHTVIFTLKKDAPEGTADALVADALEMLPKIPSVRAIQAGKPAEDATPALAQKNYQVGLVILFDNAEGLKTYLEHEQHLKMVEKHSKHVDREKLLIYDFENKSK